MRSTVSGWKRVKWLKKGNGQHFEIVLIRYMQTHFEQLLYLHEPKYSA